jgi:hypothetical protein
MLLQSSYDIQWEPVWIRTKSVFRIKPEPPGSFVRYAVTHDA